MSYVVYSNPVLEKFASKFGKVHEIERDYFPNGMPDFKTLKLTTLN